MSSAGCWLRWTWEFLSLIAGLLLLPNKQVEVQPAAESGWCSPGAAAAQTMCKVSHKPLRCWQGDTGWPIWPPAPPPPPPMYQHFCSLPSMPFCFVLLNSWPVCWLTGLGPCYRCSVGGRFHTQRRQQRVNIFPGTYVNFLFLYQFFFRDFALIIVNVFFPCMVHYIVLKASVSNVWVSALLWHLGLLYTSCFKFTFAQLPICSYPLG